MASEAAFSDLLLPRSLFVSSEWSLQPLSGLMALDSLHLELKPKLGAEALPKHKAVKVRSAQVRGACI